MVNINDCTIRYYLGPARLMQHELIYELKRIMNLMSDLLPEYVIHSDDEYVWAYCTFPIDDKCKQLISRGTCGIFTFYMEESLC